MQADTTQSPSGNVIDEGRYRVVRRLGRGGMGDVLLVLDAVRGEEVKRVLEQTTDSLIRFKREFRVIAELLHPNLVQLYDLGQGPEGPFFTMEAIDGLTLGDYCANPTQELERVVLGGESSEDPELASGLEPTIAPTGELASGLEPTIAPTGELAFDATLASTGPRAGLGATVTASGHASFIADGDAWPHGRAPLASAPGVRLDAVLHTAPQLLEALAFLHSHGIVHRDLKPSNVMVRRDGVVKLLDFGILATPVEASREAGQIMGTLGFMAPELFQGAPPSLSTDLYALGATFYILLTGRVPFPGGTPMQQLVAQQQREPPRLDTLIEGLPEALVELVQALLRREPESRATLDAAARALERAGARRARLASTERGVTRLFGREALLESTLSVCRATLEEGAPPVVLRGPSGSGKTAVAEHLAQGFARDGVLVLRGRGRHNERLAFNAIDAVVDELALILKRAWRPSAEVRRLAAQASSVFPVLAEVGEGEAEANRAQALLSLRALIPQLAPSRQALLVIDDLQWADDDSLRALYSLHGEGLGLLATLRSDVGVTDADAWCQLTRSVVHEVEPLGEEALTAIVRGAARRAGEAAPDEAAVREALRLSQGKPFLAEIAGRAIVQGGGEDPLGALVRRATSRYPRLLAAVIAADDWISNDTLRHHLDRPLGPIDDAARQLEAEGVVRRAGTPGPEGLVDVYHDALRGALHDVLADAMSSAHARFADLADAGVLELPPARQVRHQLAASRFSEAARTARVAADAAAEQLAYGLEADMLAIVIEHGALESGSRSALLERRGEALEKAARYRDAAGVWDQLTEDTEGVEVKIAASRAANAYFGANEVAIGAERLSVALEGDGDGNLGRRGVREIWSALRFLRGPRRGSLGAKEDPIARRRAEANVRLGLLLGVFDPIQGLHMLIRAHNAFFKLGDAERVVWCQLIFAFFAQYAHQGTRESRLCLRYLKAANARAEAHGIQRAEHDAMREFIAGSTCLRHGDWEGAWARGEDMLAHLDGAGLRGVFEYTYGATHMAAVAYIRQDLGQLEDMLELLRELQQDSGDLALATHKAMIEVGVHLFNGRFDEARRAGLRCADALPEGSLMTIQRGLAGYVRALPEIYDGDPRDALTLVLESDPFFLHFNIDSCNIGGFHVAHAALAEVLALRLEDPRFKRRRFKKRLKRLERSGPIVAGIRERIRAYDADARGKPEKAVALLRASIEAATEAARPLDVAIASFQLGLRCGGEEGARLLRDARQAIARLGVCERILHEDPVHRGS